MKRKYTILSIVILIILAVIASLLLFYNRSTNNNSISKTYQKTKSVSVKPPAATATQPKLAHIFLIVEENRTYSSVIGNSQAPYINSLAKKYSLATNYSGVTHPSLPNYLALTSGSTDGTTTDCNPPSAGCIVNVKNIADEIASSGRTWKQYAEGMPSACYAYNDLQSQYQFATKHVPFLYYSDIINNSQLCKSHVVPYSQLAIDLKSIATTPNYAFITPNLCNDGHNCPTSTMDTWLASNVPTILNSKAFITQPSLLVITFDEGNLSDNHIATIFAGSAAKSNYQSSLAFNHYALLHTIESLWGLKPLTSNDANAPLMTSMMSQKFIP